MSQLFVIVGEGWAKAAGLELQLTRFSSGPAMVQALASGGYEVAYIGIGPAMVASASGLDLRVTAANGINQGSLIGVGAFAEGFAAAASPAAAFAAFRQKTGRPVRVATLPKGSVPDTVLQYWLNEVAHVAPGDVQVLGVGEDRVQQALLSGSAEAAGALEPILTIVQERGAFGEDSGDGGDDVSQSAGGGAGDPGGDDCGAAGGGADAGRAACAGDEAGAGGSGKGGKECGGDHRAGAGVGGDAGEGVHFAGDGADFGSASDFGADDSVGGLPAEDRDARGCWSIRRCCSIRRCSMGCRRGRSEGLHSSPTVWRRSQIRKGRATLYAPPPGERRSSTPTRHASSDAGRRRSAARPAAARTCRRAALRAAGGRTRRDGPQPVRSPERFHRAGRRFARPEARPRVDKSRPVRFVPGDQESSPRSTIATMSPVREGFPLARPGRGLRRDSTPPRAGLGSPMARAGGATTGIRAIRFATDARSG